MIYAVKFIANVTVEMNIHADDLEDVLNIANNMDYDDIIGNGVIRVYSMEEVLEEDVESLEDLEYPEDDLFSVVVDGKTMAAVPVPYSLADAIAKRVREKGGENVTIIYKGKAGDSN